MALKLGALPSTSMPRLLIAASGTGGHLFPALAVADRLAQAWSVRWLGVPDRLERQLVPARYPLFTVRAGGLQGRGLRKLQQLLRLLFSTVPVMQLIRRDGCRIRRGNRHRHLRDVAAGVYDLPGARRIARGRPR